MATGDVTEYLSQGETIHATWYGGDTQYAASDRRIGMLRDNNFRDLPYSEIESVRTTTRTVGGEWDGVGGFVKMALGIGLGAVGAFALLGSILNLFNGALIAAIGGFVFALLSLYAGLQGYRGWKQRSRETRDQPFVVFELGQTTKVDVDAFGHADVNSETQVLEIPVPDESTMKTVTSNVR